MYNFPVASALGIFTNFVKSLFNLVTSFRIDNIPFGSIIIAFFTITLITRVLLSKILGASPSGSDMVNLGKQAYKKHQASKQKQSRK